MAAQALPCAPPNASASAAATGSMRWRCCFHRILAALDYFMLVNEKMQGRENGLGTIKQRR
jgi:hypothetical protein